MEKQKVIDLLNFQSQFTKIEWNDLLHQINAQYNKKANELQLTDSDIKEITAIITFR